MILYRTTDKIPVKIGEATFWLSPLSVSQKTELMSLVTVNGGEELTRSMELALLAIRMSLKEVDGVQDADGESYQLTHDESGLVSKECVEELLGLEHSDGLIHVVKQFAFGELKDPKIDGVTVDFSNVKTLKKSRKAESQAS